MRKDGETISESRVDGEDPVGGRTFDSRANSQQQQQPTTAGTTTPTTTTSTIRIDPNPISPTSSESSPPIEAPSKNNNDQSGEDNNPKIRDQLKVKIQATVFTPNNLVYHVYEFDGSGASTKSQMLLKDPNANDDVLKYVLLIIFAILVAFFVLIICIKICFIDVNTGLF